MEIRDNHDKLFQIDYFTKFTIYFKFLMCSFSIRTFVITWACASIKLIIAHFRLFITVTNYQNCIENFVVCSKLMNVRNSSHKYYLLRPREGLWVTINFLVNLSNIVKLPLIIIALGWFCK